MCAASGSARPGLPGWRVLAALGLALGGTGGCVRRPPVTPPRPLQQCVAYTRPVPRDSLTKLGGTQPPEDYMLRVSRTMPGGFTTVTVYAERWRTVLQMVDTTRADTVRAALLAELAADTSGLNPWFAERVRAAELQQSRFSRVELLDWKSYITTLVWSGGNNEASRVSGIGVDFRLERIRLTVPTDVERARLEEVLGRAEIPCGLVETELGGFVATAASDRR